MSSPFHLLVFQAMQITEQDPSAPVVTITSRFSVHKGRGVGGRHVSELDIDVGDKLVSDDSNVTA